MNDLYAKLLSGMTEGRPVSVTPYQRTSLQRIAKRIGVQTASWKGDEGKLWVIILRRTRPTVCAKCGHQARGR